MRWRQPSPLACLVWPPRPWPKDTIKIAIAGPQTGPVAQYGDMEFAGAKIAVEQINAAGGIDGKEN